MKNTNGGVLLLAKAYNFTKSKTPPWVFSSFLNCANGIKWRKARHIVTLADYEPTRSHVDPSQFLYDVEYRPGWERRALAHAM